MSRRKIVIGYFETGEFPEKFRCNSVHRVHLFVFDGQYTFRDSQYMTLAGFLLNMRYFVNLFS